MDTHLYSATDIDELSLTTVILQREEDRLPCYRGNWSGCRRHNRRSRLAGDGDRGYGQECGCMEGGEHERMLPDRYADPQQAQCRMQVGLCGRQKGFTRMRGEDIFALGRQARSGEADLSVDCRYGMGKNVATFPKGTFGKLVWQVTIRDWRPGNSEASPIFHLVPRGLDGDVHINGLTTQ